MSSNFKPWLLLIGIFIIGVVTGWALNFGLAPHFMPKPGPHDVRRHWMDRLTRELDLTTDQQTKIQPILRDTADKVQKIHQEEFDKIRPILQASDDQIAAILTPDAAGRAEADDQRSARKLSCKNGQRQWGTSPRRRPRRHVTSTTAEPPMAAIGPPEQAARAPATNAPPK
jgi:Spy/CpxP family protein refolding chaperone